MKDILFLLINYKNKTEIVDFICHIKKLLKEDNIDYSIIVSDNSSDKKEFDYLNNLYKADNNVYINDTGENLGYLKGAYNGYNYFFDKLKQQAKWVFVCNTDLKLENNFFKVFMSKYFYHNLIIAPNIELKSSGIHQNPFMRKRPSKISFSFRLIIMKYPILYIIYKNLFSQIWLKIKDKLKNKSNDFKNKENNYIYAAHGSFCLLPLIFFERKCTLNYFNFLFGEEIFIAEQAKENNIKIQLCNDLKVIHNENQTTSGVNDSKIAFFNYLSLKELKKRYFFK